MLKTWDIFDTLITRRCMNPHFVFRIMEQSLKIGGFEKARLAAEKRVASRVSNYNLDDIYNEFASIAKNVTPQILENWKKFECDTEIKQAIPITENILQVKAGDILISDMYLSETIIRKMLEKCGLIVPVEVIITSNGKASGRIWKQIAEQNEFVFHIGDNEISDIKNPRDAGFDSALTILSRPNVVEKFLMQQDFNFAMYLREIRLKNPYTEEIKRKYWEIFTLNIGILIILVQLIDDLQKKCGFEYLGFCGRDTHYLWLLYKKFKDDRNETPPPSDYLYYSRKIIHTSEKEIAKYFLSKIDNRKALMIDLCGTGTHLNKLRLEQNIDYSILLCGLIGESIAKSQYKNEVYPTNWISYEDLKTSADISGNFYFNADKGIWNQALEHCNRSTHNTPVKLNLTAIENKVVPNPIFSELSDTENLDVFENCLQEVLKSKVNWIKIENAPFLLKNLLIIFYNWATPLINIFMTRQILDGKMDQSNTWK